MEPTIQHKLANLEIAPPQGGWELLSARLDTEFDKSEIRLAQTLNDTALTPPAGAWAAIASRLPAEEELISEPAAPARVVSFPFRRVAVAAAVLIVISFVSWFMLRPGTAVAPSVNESATGNGQATTRPPSSPNQIAMPPSIAQEIPDVPRKQSPIVSGDDNDENNLISNDNSTDQYIEQSDLPSADPSIVRAQNMPQQVSIPNRAFRDKAGKVVMDMNLLTTPGNQYVTVTAPNGEQTKISRKFLPVLTFVNTGADNGQFNSTLKQKIQDLRKQLLQHASFVPSATNFLDIMELKELLQDK